MEPQELFKSVLVLYDEGKDSTDLVYEIQQCATEGHPLAQLFLGWCYHFGAGVTQSNKEAVHWYQEAYKQQEPSAADWLGNCYACGIGVEQNYEKALECYSFAAEHDRPMAQEQLGKMYMMGIGVEQDDEMAALWLRCSCLNPETQALLESVKQQEHNSCESRSYSTGNNFSHCSIHAEAFLLLTELTETGRGTEKDALEAARLRELAKLLQSKRPD